VRHRRFGRREFIALLGAAAAGVGVLPRAACAQQPPKLRVGFVGM